MHVDDFLHCQQVITVQSLKILDCDHNNLKSHTKDELWFFDGVKWFTLVVPYSINFLPQKKHESASCMLVIWIFK